MFAFKIIVILTIHIIHHGRARLIWGYEKKGLRKTFGITLNVIFQFFDFLKA